MLYWKYVSSIFWFIYFIKFPSNLMYRSRHRWTCNFVKKRLQRRLFPLNIAKFLRTLFSKNICERLLLIVVICCIKNWIELLSNQISLLFYFTSDQSFVSNHSILVTLIRFHSFFVTRCHLLSLVVTRHS